MANFNYTWHVTSFDKDENGKPTHIHFALEGEYQGNTAFTYGSIKITEKLGVPDKFVTLSFLKEYVMKNLSSKIKERHKQEIIRKSLY